MLLNDLYWTALSNYRFMFITELEIASIFYLEIYTYFNFRRKAVSVR